MREATHYGGGVACLELLKTAAIDDAHDDFARIDNLMEIDGGDAVQFFRVVEWRLGAEHVELLAFGRLHGVEDVAADLQGMGVVFGQMVGNTR